MSKKKSVKKLLQNDFAIFSNDSISGEKLSAEDTVFCLQEEGFTRVQELVGVNSAGVPRNFFLVGLSGLSIDKRMDLYDFVQTVLEQQFMTLGYSGHEFCLYDLQDDKIVCSASDIQKFGDIPKNNYYISQNDGFCFTFNFDKGE